MKKDDQSKKLEQAAAEQAQQDTQPQEQTRSDNHIQVLIPFDASKDNVRRLQAVIRSFLLYAQFEFTPVIVGDRPALFNDSVMAIPFDEGVPHDLVGAAVSGAHSELVNNHFIVAPLETYLNRPTLMAHFMLPKCHANGYEFRYPIFVHKEAMVRVCDNLASNGQPVSEGVLTLYYRLHDVPPMWLDWPKDFILLPVISEHPDMDKLAAYLPHKSAVYVQHVLAFDELLTSVFADLFDEQNDPELGLYENPA